MMCRRRGSYGDTPRLGVGRNAGPWWSARLGTQISDKSYRSDIIGQHRVRRTSIGSGDNVEVSLQTEELVESVGSSCSQLRLPACDKFDAP